MNPNAKLFVGSLSWTTTDESLANFFSQVGTVVSAKVITDRETRRSRGFGFVEMATPEEAEKARVELDKKELDGRAINVSIAKPQESRENHGGGSFNRGGGSRRDDRRPRYEKRNNY